VYYLKLLFRDELAKLPPREVIRVALRWIAYGMHLSTLGFHLLGDYAFLFKKASMNVKLLSTNSPANVG
jgi:hypothetical protein